MNDIKESTVEFASDDEGIKLMAIFIAQLVREGVTYKVDRWNDNYYVTLTGGF